MVAVPLPQASCLKCKRQEQNLVYARKDAYCRDCFILFAKSKYRRAIDAFRLELPIKQRDPKMLLAFSGGVGSSVLLDLAYTAVARTRGRYEMPKVLYIDVSEFTNESIEANETRFNRMRQRYPEMTFIKKSLSSIEQYTTLRANEHNGPATGASNSDVAAIALKECIASLPSRTSQEDMLAMYKERLILETAREQSCEAILFGNSGTSLAAKTLALTAKGRGYALPWETADHSLSHSGIWSLRPMKGLMSAEVETYADLIGLPVPPLKKSTTMQPTSIDELTKKYFDGLEVQFPSLVATVVRTTNKLVEPVPLSEATGICRICGMSYQEDAREWLSNITVSVAAPDHATHLEQADAGSVSEMQLCYGCVVAMRGSKGESVWPAFVPNSTQSSRNHGIEDVLSEFDLKDD